MWGFDKGTQSRDGTTNIASGDEVERGLVWKRFWIRERGMEERLRFAVALLRTTLLPASVLSIFAF